MAFSSILLILQVAAAQLTGTVVDPRGAAVLGASITMTEVNTNKEIRTVTETGGSYNAFPVKPGLYRVTVEAAGFQRFVREGVRMTTGERVPLDFRLEVGATSQSVTVMADASILRDASANVGQIV